MTAAILWEDMLAYCDALVLGGRGDWRLPSISELRSFVRGCDALMTGGECGVTDECTQETGCWNNSCEAGSEVGGPCEFGNGPGEDGMYWDPEIISGGTFIYRSSTAMNPSAPFDIWYIRFSNMILYDGEATTTSNLRCVRTGL